MGGKRPMSYGPWNIAPLHVWTFFLLTHEISQGDKIFIINKNNIVIKTTSGNIILDCQMKMHDGWTIGVEFFWEKKARRLICYNPMIESLNIIGMSTCYIMIYVILLKLAKGKAIGLQATSVFNSCEDCALGKANKMTSANQLWHAPPCREKGCSLN